MRRPDSCMLHLGFCMLGSQSKSGNGAEGNPFNLQMEKSGLHLKISSLLILTLLIFMKLYQEVEDFNTVAPAL